MSIEAFEMPQDPIQLAEIRAQQATGQDFDITQQDEFLLAELDYAAEELGFLNNRYYLSAYTGFQIPVGFEDANQVSYTKINDLAAEAVFATYAKIHIGEIIGAGAVRAVCLCFTEGTVYNEFSEIPDDQLLYVPVLAVNEIAEAV